MAWLSQGALQGVADWLVTFAIHSTCILSLALLASLSLRQRLLAWQERMLRFSLWAALVSSTAQLVFATPPLSLSLPRHEPAPAAIESVSAVPVDPVEIAALLAAAEGSEAWPAAYWMLVGALLLAFGGTTWLWRSHRSLRRLLRSRQPETDGRTLAIAAEAARTLGLRQSPHVSCSPKILTPIAFGCLRPEICVPIRARALDTDQLRAMLAHEIAHLRRLDPIWMWLAAGLHALFPWQLLFAAARRRWGHLVELRCDAIAAAQTSPTTVARCLLDVAEWLRPPARVPAVALGMAARPSALRLRVETALRGGAAGRVRPGWSTSIGALSLSVLTFAAPGVDSNTPTEFDVMAPSPAAVTADAAPPPAALHSTFALLDSERRELERQLEGLRSRAATHPRGPSVQPLIAQIAQRLLTVERSWQQLQRLLDRRESRIPLLNSR